jgi:4-hydroxymandelate oxidase
MTPLNLSDFEGVAREKLPQPSFDYIAGGAGDEITLAENRWALDRLQLRPRVLVDVSEVELGGKLFAHELALPVILAPVAFQALAHPEAEIATARAAAVAGTIFTVSTLASRRLEDIAAAADGPLWFQLYCSRRREITQALVERAVAAGYSALVVTVDTPVVGRRERDLRNNFQLPADALPLNLLPYVDLEGLTRAEQTSSLVTIVDGLFDPTLTWDDLAWLRGLSSLPVLVKGILTAEDARLALEHGAGGIMVSNHGGRQLDTVPATIDVLPEIVVAVDGRVPILVDGGIQRGTDVIKALALGAQAVAIGRSYLWGLAADGEAGVTAVLDVLRQEIASALALVGCPDARKLTASSIRRR